MKEQSIAPIGLQLIQAAAAGGITQVPQFNVFHTLTSCHPFLLYHLPWSSVFEYLPHACTLELGASDCSLVALMFLPCDSPQLAQLAQQQNADVNQQVAPLGRTALHAAAEAGQAACCQFLLEQLGADPYVYDNEGLSAVMLAARNGHHQVIEVRSETGCSSLTTVLHIACLWCL